MESFQVGQRVRSRVNGQSLVVGQVVDVVSISVRRTFCGSFVTLTVRSESGLESQVVNSHLVLESVS